MNYHDIAHVYDAFLGLDLGQSFDYTAWCLVEQPLWLPAGLPLDLSGARPALSGYFSIADVVPGQVRYCRLLGEHHGRPAQPELHLRHIERTRHVGYPEIVKRTVELLAAPMLAGAQVALVVDYGGVGRAVVDLLRQAGLDPIGCTITGGDRVNVADVTDLRVPKRELVAATQSALQSGRLKIAAGLEHAETLRRELLGYRVKLSASGHDSYAGREGEHDDTVMATALAVWYRDWSMGLWDQAHAAAQRPQAS